MTTKRNNMFHDRGFTGGINLALQAIKEYDDLDKVKDYLLKFKESYTKWMTDCAPGFARSSIETKSLITNYYFITVKDGKYVTTENQSYNLTYRTKFSEWVYWSESTSTQCIVVIHGDEAAADFVDDDFNFKDNIANLIGIADDWEIIERPKVIELIDNWRYDYFN